MPDSLLFGIVPGLTARFSYGTAELSLIPETVMPVPKCLPILNAVGITFKHTPT